jgi:N-acetylglucosaminyldiphosphoundecaprenol N-acetyl-beta-D-mannosaminyltransferase
MHVRVGDAAEQVVHPFIHGHRGWLNRAQHIGHHCHRGDGPGVAERTAQILLSQNPAFRIAGTYAGSPAEVDAPALVERVRLTQPDILWDAYGAPAQDLWIARHQPRLRVPLAMGVGGTFDYLAGRVPRAPRLLRRLGLEWAYRLFMQPARWRRIIDAVPRFAFAVLRNGRPAAPSA